MQATRYNIEEWRLYYQWIYIALHGELTEFQREFLSSCYKQLGGLSVKQTNLLRKVLREVFIR